MSDQPQENTDAPSASQSSGGKSSRKGLLIALAVIALAAVGYCYDTFVVPGKVQAGFDVVADAKLKSLVAEKSLTNTEVRGLLGKEPSTEFDDGNGLHHEVFHWTGGMLVNSHKLYTVYSKEGDQWVFQSHSLHSEDSPERALVTVEADPEGEEGEAYEEEAGLGNGDNTPVPEDRPTDAPSRPAMEDDADSSSAEAAAAAESDADSGDEGETDSADEPTP